MNIANLEILAGHLEGADQRGFDMFAFARDEDEEDLPIHAHECATVCCAAGSGPAAGLPVIATDGGWGDYTHRVFGLLPLGTEWQWCFSGIWSVIDNTPAGAAKRIRHLINLGLPDDANEQMHGLTPYLFGAKH